jgi:ubiquinone/menaquinone biosynthesis C-methylase UbiE
MLQNEISALPREIFEYYADPAQEDGRLSGGNGPLELERTKRLIARYLPAPPQVVRDVGGGTGIYSCWLAELGYQTHLLDAVPALVEMAKNKTAEGVALASAQVGDARDLPWPDNSSDLVLLFGPLYHLTEKRDRLLVLREALRVLKPGGLVLAVAIPRLVTTMNALLQGMGSANEFWEMARVDAQTGQHRSRPSTPNFTTAYFHDPDEFAAEFKESEFLLEDFVGVEGPGWLAPDFPVLWSDQTRRAQILEAAASLERRTDIMGMNKHVMAVGRKQF